jgi:hypothetical protein
MKIAIRALLLIIVTFSFASSSALAATEQCHPKRGVSSHIVVKARPHVIYETIRGLREKSGNSIKELEKTEDHALLEELFNGLPIIGNARCVYIENYLPDRKISYRMVESDKFKAFEGEWLITPTPGEQECLVEVSSFVDTGLRIPFARQMTDAAAVRDLERRLQEVKQVAENLPCKTTDSQKHGIN